MQAKVNNEQGETAKNILKAAVKALYTINSLPHISNAIVFENFYRRVLKTKLLIPMIDEIKNKK